MSSLNIYLLVAVGGAFGASLRFFISQIMLQWLGKGFPFGTLLVNVVGSFLLGWVYSLTEHGHLEIVPWRTLIAIGFLGAFTTFSTFSVDSLLLLQQGHYLKGILNIFLNLSCCLGAAWVGLHIIKG
ncbi:fluoride efflux transporter CrcB [Planctobacterium marinum]|uniref:fluoride efflux transporter CrcB n=1 Tax=Planctobacterium marinum TaxID=1631968 RepID=UPI001E5A3DC9|nr:fluoride efflux transporter CrcB [Planctobacterium marinum]MCC2604117.1 fluoride efflux transporter CrcB [Planctobacterium marinum]